MNQIPGMGEEPQSLSVALLSMVLASQSLNNVPRIVPINVLSDGGAVFSDKRTLSLELLAPVPPPDSLLPALLLLAAPEACEAVQENATGEEHAASPPPEERTFVDDDGTAYDWDPVQRRFVEISSGAALPDYGVHDMTFAVEADVIPPIPERLQVRYKGSILYHQQG